MEYKATIIQMSDEENKAGEQSEVSFRLGIKEVVEWINETAPRGNQYWHSLASPKLLLDIAEWQAKIKEWRIT